MVGRAHQGSRNDAKDTFQLFLDCFLRCTSLFPIAGSALAVRRTSGTGHLCAMQPTWVAHGLAVDERFPPSLTRPRSAWGQRSETWRRTGRQPSPTDRNRRPRASETHRKRGQQVPRRALRRSEISHRSGPIVSIPVEPPPRSTRGAPTPSGTGPRARSAVRRAPDHDRQTTISDLVRPLLDHQLSVRPSRNRSGLSASLRTSVSSHRRLRWRIRPDSRSSSYAVRAWSTW